MGRIKETFEKNSLWQPPVIGFLLINLLSGVLIIVVIVGGIWMIGWKVGRS